jgi:hypothetical protein
MRPGRRHLAVLLFLAIVALAFAGPNDESGCQKLSNEAEFDAFVQVRNCAEQPPVVVVAAGGASR